jgi:hypothetical protein
MAVRGPHRLWTRGETNRLIIHWGTKDLVALAQMLGRTPQAITERAKKLHLGTQNRGTKTMQQIRRESGYELSRLWAAVDILGLVIHRGLRMDPRQTKATHRFAVSEEQEAAILQFLGTQLDGRRLFSYRGTRTQNGVWGVGLKPPACLSCGTSARPHCARGCCANCYARQRKRAKRETREDRRADTR